MTRIDERPPSPEAGLTHRSRLPRWARLVLAFAAACGAVALMIGLSIWQWDRGRARGSLLNYTYAAEWLIFAVLTVVGFVRLALEDRRSAAEARKERSVRPPEPAPPAPGGVVPLVGPPLRPGEELEELTWVRLRRRMGLDRS